MLAIQHRFSIHSLLTLALMGVYGVQVCPFVESLTPLQLLTPIALVLLVQIALRWGLERYVNKANIKHQVNRQFRLDLGLFVVSGILLAVFNTVVYRFPPDSGAKLVIGFAILGIFIACELALFRQFKLGEHLASKGMQIEPDEFPYPLMRKFSWLATLCAFSIVGVVFLVINKDLHWLIDAGNTVPLNTARGYILGEIAFVVMVLMTYVVAIIAGFSRNLSVFLHAENTTLALVSKGDLKAQVPVTSNDEFGLMAQHTNVMIRALSEQHETLRLTQDASILSLASLAETRDNETGAHILRTQQYVRALAEHLATSPHYQTVLDADTIALLYKSAPLHDIGKVGIPDRILLKPGKLTGEEFAIMKQHPQIGSDALAAAETRLGTNSFLRLAREISLTHHEKWDGSGYPNGLAGNAIPLSGRLMALADVYDALISERVYKPAFSHEKARDIILDGKGKHFDPAIVDAFIEIEDTFRSIAIEYGEIKALAA